MHDFKITAIGELNIELSNLNSFLSEQFGPKHLFIRQSASQADAEFAQFKTYGVYNSAALYSTKFYECIGS
jgi:hypothetical protein